MTNDWYTADKVHLLKAEKMATWRNGDAKLETADVHAVDEYISGRLYEPIGTVAPLATGVSYLPRFKTNHYIPGTWDEYLYFQTAMNLYPAMGICNTADNTPSASLYTHTFGIRTGQTPLNMGRHWQRENETAAESEIIDILGMMLNHCHIECSEASPVAVQHNKWGVSFTKNSSTDDITAASLAVAPFKWSDFTFPVFTYNSETIEANIVGWAHDIVNTLQYTGLDTSGYYSIGKYIPLTYITTSLEIIPYGHNAFELIRTNLGSYATDLDLTVKPARSATDYVQWVHDKCYCQPFIMTAEKSPTKIERYLLVMSQLDTGSLVPTAVDIYDDDYYET